MDEGRAIPADAVRAQLERVLASKGFANAGRLSRLLRHVVDKTLSGEADQLKEYTVGIEVFDRDEKYDPRLDSIVRVEAGRLRSRLDEYYINEGATDQVRIGLPRGAYAAQFERRGEPAGPPPITTTEGAAEATGHPASNGHSRASWALGAVGVLAVATIAVWLYGSRQVSAAPSIAVLAFEQYSAAGEDSSVAAQLTESVTSELARLGTVGVVSHTSAMQFAGIRKPLREIARALDADFILEASVENKPGGIVVVARMVDAETDRKMWVDDFPARTDELRDVSRRIAAAASSAVLSGRATAR